MLPKASAVIVVPSGITPPSTDVVAIGNVQVYGALIFPEPSTVIVVPSGITPPNEPVVAAGNVYGAGSVFEIVIVLLPAS